jgi:putative membrane protein
MRTITLAAVVGTILLVACSKDNTNGYDSTGVGDSSNTMAGAPPAATPLTDANIMALMDEVNAADSTMGKTASTKATSADVKAFGTLMMRDHHTLRKDGQDLAAKLNITPAAPADDSLPRIVQAATDSLSSIAKGAAWDKAYIDNEVGTHQLVLALIAKAQDATQTPELDEALTKAKGIVQGHLQTAQGIQSKLAAGPSGNQ